MNGGTQGHLRRQFPINLAAGSRREITDALLKSEVIAHVRTARHLVHISLSRLESRLDPLKFTRVHRSHIVKLAQVRAFKSDASGNMEAELLEGARVPVSRARAQELRKVGK